MKTLALMTVFNTINYDTW